MITIDPEKLGDWRAREALLDRVMGPDRFLKPSQLLRDGRLPAECLALVARDGGKVVGTVRLWEVIAGGRKALLLGPLAVAPEAQGEGIGSRLMQTAIRRATALGHGAVLLIGDAPYYARFGFSSLLTQRLAMPAAVDRSRFLGLELRPGALAGAAGPMLAAGEPMVPALVAAQAAARVAA
jgi:predicted N-acetyltransferase YhbS